MCALPAPQHGWFRTLYDFLCPLQVAPSSHQAAELKSAVNDAIVKEGLVGVGVGTGLLTVAAVAIGLLVSSRRH